MQVSREVRLRRQLQSRLQYLLKLTSFGVVGWKRTADHNETFTTSMKGLFFATIWEDSQRRYFRLVNRDGQTEIVATSADSDAVDALYSEAKRRAFNLDKAIADIVLRRGC